MSKAKVKRARLDLEIEHMCKNWYQLGAEMVICLGRLKPVTFITQLLLNNVGEGEQCVKCNSTGVIFLRKIWTLHIWRHHPLERSNANRIRNINVIVSYVPKRRMKLHPLANLPQDEVFCLRLSCILLLSPTKKKWNLMNQYYSWRPLKMDNSWL